jgi:hypothetical protein
MISTAEDRDIEDFFLSLRDFDSNILVIKELENEIKKRQGGFSEID